MWLRCQVTDELTVFLSLSKKKDGKFQNKEQSAESHYRIVSPTFQYKMSHRHVGKCIIINNKNFDERTGVFCPPIELLKYISISQLVTLITYRVHIIIHKRKYVLLTDV